MSIVGELIGDGRYRIDGRLSRGGMGDVYSAFDIRTRTSVAIKLLAPELTAHIENRARLKRGGRIQADLRHPSICRVFDIIDEGVRLGVVMERLDGRTLAERVRESGPADPATLWRWMRPIFDAVHTAHEAGVIHRGLRSGHVLLVREGGRAVPKVLDFGIAKIVDEARTVITRRSGRLLGRPDFMAPEQLRGDPVDERTDVYALGAMLYHLATGHLPFAEEGAAARLSRPEASVSHPPSSRAPRLTPLFDDCVGTAMMPEPERRFRSVLALSDAFDRAMKAMLPASEWVHVHPLRTEGGVDEASPQAADDPSLASPVRLSAPPQESGAAGGARVSEVSHPISAPPGDTADEVGIPPASDGPGASPTARSSRRARIGVLLTLALLLMGLVWWGQQPDCVADRDCAVGGVCHSGRCVERAASAAAFYRDVIDAYNRRDRSGYFDAWDETIDCFWRRDRTWSLDEIRRKRSFQFDEGGQRIEIRSLEARRVDGDRVLLAEKSLHHKGESDEAVEREVALRRSRGTWWIIGEAAPGAECLPR